MIRRVVSVAAVAALVSGVISLPAPTRAVEFVAPTYYVAHEDGSYAGGSPCASPDYTATDAGGASHDDAIRSAVAAAASGSIIHICAGRYLFGDEVVVGNLVSLTFEGDGADETILDGGGASRIFAAGGNGVTGDENDGGSTLTLRDLTIEDADHGNPFANGGAVIADSLTLEHVTVSGSTGAYNGGALYTEGDVSIVDSELVNNSNSQDGAALYAWGSNTTVAIVRSTFAGNSADGTAGAIAAAGDLSTLDSEFLGNTSGEAGGAILNAGTEGIVAGTVSIVRTNFVENQSGLLGGALVIQNHESFVIDSSDFIANRALTFGGAVNMFNNEIVEIRDTRFIENEARGGDTERNGNGGAIDACNIGSFSSVHSLYQGNVSTGFGGAIGFFGITCFFPGSIELVGNRFVGNEASDNGGAIWFAGTLARVVRNRFVQNVSGGYGGAIFGGWCGICGVARAELVRGNLFVRNHAEYIGGAIWLQGNIGRLVRNDFRGNSAGFYGGALALDFITADYRRIVRGNFITRNVAGEGGGGIFLSCSSLSRSAIRRLVVANRLSANRALEHRRWGAIYQPPFC